MKMKKLLLLATAAMLISPAFAEDLAPGTATGQTNTATTTLDLTLSPFIDITTQATNHSSAVTYLDDYSNINITTPLVAEWQVITNKATVTGDEGEEPKDCVRLTATAGNTGYNALGAASDAAFYIVFANTSKAPDSTSVESARTLGSSENNPNAFAIKVNPNIVAVAKTGATAPTPDFQETYVDYPLTNGIYTMTYNFVTSAETKTFSTKDTNGSYTATLTLTQQSI